MDLTLTSFIFFSASHFLADVSPILVICFIDALGLVLFTIHFSQRKAGCKCIWGFLGPPTQTHLSQRHLHTHTRAHNTHTCTHMCAHTHPPRRAGGAAWWYWERRGDLSSCARSIFSSLHLLPWLQTILFISCFPVSESIVSCVYIWRLTTALFSRNQIHSNRAGTTSLLKPILARFLQLLFWWISNITAQTADPKFSTEQVLLDLQIPAEISAPWGALFIWS